MGEVGFVDESCDRGYFLVLCLIDYLHLPYAEKALKTSKYRKEKRSKIRKNLLIKFLHELIAHSSVDVNIFAYPFKKARIESLKLLNSTIYKRNVHVVYFSRFNDVIGENLRSLLRDSINKIENTRPDSIRGRIADALAYAYHLYNKGDAKIKSFFKRYSATIKVHPIRIL